jgi:hypothetical protein
LQTNYQTTANPIPQAKTTGPTKPPIAEAVTTKPEVTKPKRATRRKVVKDNTNVNTTTTDADKGNQDSTEGVQLDQTDKEQEDRGYQQEDQEEVANAIIIDPALKDRVSVAAPFRGRVDNYVLNNREQFVQFINQLFLPYKNGSVSGTSTGTRHPHQQLVLDYINTYTPYRGLLLYHGLGAGKTNASIGIAEGIGTAEGIASVKRIYVMLPASLADNYLKEIKKHGHQMYRENQRWEWITDSSKWEQISALLGVSMEYIRLKKGVWLPDKNRPKNALTGEQTSSLKKQLDQMIRHRYHFISTNGLTQAAFRKMTRQYTHNPFSNTVVIIDEAHNFISRIVNKLNAMSPTDQKSGSIRSQTSLAIRLYYHLLTAENCRIVMLSGTPIINYPNEIGVMFNILRGYIYTWTFRVVSASVALSTEAFQTTLLAENKEINYVRYDPNAKVLTITRNPYGFENTGTTVTNAALLANATNNNNNNNNNNSNNNTPISNAEWADSIVDLLKRQKVTVTMEGEPQAFLALPHFREPFLKRYIDMSTGNVVNIEQFKKRIIGLTSYFKAASEHLLPRYNEATDFRLEKIPMSDYQFEAYEQARQDERKQESNARKMAKKSSIEEQFDDMPANYRMFSRMFCNFAMPDPPGRPQPGEFKKPKQATVAIVEDTNTDNTNNTTNTVTKGNTNAATNMVIPPIAIVTTGNKLADKAALAKAKLEAKQAKELAKEQARQAKLDAKEQAKQAKLVAKQTKAKGKHGGNGTGANATDDNVDNTATTEAAEANVQVNKNEEKEEEVNDNDNEDEQEEEKDDEEEDVNDNDEQEEDVNDNDEQEEDVNDIDNNDVNKEEEDNEEEEEEDDDALIVNGSNIRDKTGGGGGNSETMEDEMTAADLETDAVLAERGGESYMAAIAKSMQYLESNMETTLTMEHLAMYSPKYARIIENMQNSENHGLHLVYSQFSTMEGTGILALALQANGWTQLQLAKNTAGRWTITSPLSDNGKTFALYTGSQDKEHREVIRNIYNSDWHGAFAQAEPELYRQLTGVSKDNLQGNVLRGLLISSAGAEGIDLKNTCNVHLMEPYWHPVRFEQVIGRAIRIGSHLALPVEQRQVRVFAYLSVLTKKQIDGPNGQELRIWDTNLETGKPQTSDEYMYDLSMRKKRLNSQLLKAVKEASIDCATNQASSAKEGLKCMSFGNPDPYEVAFNPDATKDQSDKVANLNREVVAVTYKQFKANGVIYMVDMATHILYDADSVANKARIRVGIIKKTDDGKWTAIMDTAVK